MFFIRVTFQNSQNFHVNIDPIVARLIPHKLEISMTNRIYEGVLVIPPPKHPHIFL